MKQAITESEKPEEPDNSSNFRKKRNNKMGINMKSDVNAIEKSIREKAYKELEKEAEDVFFNISQHINPCTIITVWNATTQSYNSLMASNIILSLSKKPISKASKNPEKIRLSKSSLIQWNLCPPLTSINKKKTLIS